MTDIMEQRRNNKMRITKDCFVKHAGGSSDGTVILRDENDNFFAFNGDRCRKIVGIQNDLYCWIGNNLRVFTPAKVTIYDDTVVVELTLEKVEFIAEKCEVPKWFRDSHNLEIKEVTEDGN